MQLQFFPSKTMAFYMGRMFLIRTFAVLAMLVLVLQTLDLLGESGKILAYPGNGDAELWRYIGLRAPQIIDRFLPFSVLLGTLITLATLNQNSEVVSMKAAGLSAHQVLAPLIRTVNMVKERLNPILSIEVILFTMFDGRTSLAAQVKTEVHQHLGGQTFSTVSPRNVRLTEAPSHGRPVFLYDLKSSGAIAYLELTKEVLAHG